MGTSNIIVPKDGVEETLGSMLYAAHVSASVERGDSIDMFVPWASLHADHKLRWEHTAKTFLETANSQ